MFNPEFRYLIANDNEEPIPFLDQRLINDRGMNIFWVLACFFVGGICIRNDLILHLNWLHIGYLMYYISVIVWMCIYLFVCILQYIIIILRKGKKVNYNE
jgi:hypothetical protein